MKHLEDCENPDDGYCLECRKIFDTEDGHLAVRPGDSLNKKYHVVEILGQGTFGTVVSCTNPKAQRVAIKIGKSFPKYKTAARTELTILNTIHQQSGDYSNLVVDLLDSFEYRHHTCMVFPLLGRDLFRILEQNSYRPFPLFQIQHIGKQLFQAVSFLHKRHIIHTDIKPENILLINDSFKWIQRAPYCGFRDTKELVCTDIVIIDFGSSVEGKHKNDTIVTTIHYRAPEIIQRTGWSFPCDIWSIGCVLVELYQGFQLFRTLDPHEHLHMVETLLGAAPKTDRWDSLRPLKEIIPSTSVSMDSFYRLIQQCLDPDPQKRISPDRALLHPFFHVDIPFSE